jgi:hypothetical protein
MLRSPASNLVEFSEKMSLWLKRHFFHRKLIEMAIRDYQPLTNHLIIAINYTKL